MTPRHATPTITIGPRRWTITRGDITITAALTIAGGLLLAALTIPLVG